MSDVLLRPVPQHSNSAPPHDTWGHQPTITDGRLTLRPFDGGDLWAMLAWDQDPQTQRFFEFPPLPARDEHLRRIWWAIRRFQRDYERGARIAYVVVHAENGDVIGSIELHHITADRADVSYMTVAHRRNQGIATAALRLLCEEAGRFGIKSIALAHHADNLASAAVARKAGFTRVPSNDHLVRYELLTTR